MDARKSNNEKHKNLRVFFTRSTISSCLLFFSVTKAHPRQRYPAPWLDYHYVPVHLCPAPPFLQRCLALGQVLLGIGLLLLLRVTKHLLGIAGSLLLAFP